MNLLTLRRWHGYIGALIAPSVLFFALTGVVQLFSLHEAHGGYTPPPLIEKLSSVHKDQVFRADRHRPGPPPGAAAARPKPAGGEDDERMPLNVALLKWVFALVALGLVVTTSLGVWIALTRSRRERGLTLAPLAVGALLPIVLLVV